MAVYEKLTGIQNNLSAISQTLDEQLEDRQEEEKDLSKRAAASRHLVTLQARSKRLHEELAWAYVIDKEQVRCCEQFPC